LVIPDATIIRRGHDFWERRAEAQCANPRRHLQRTTFVAGWTRWSCGRPRAKRRHHLWL